MSTLAKRLAELGITLPSPPLAIAAYVPYVVTDNLVFISGQLPYENGIVKFKGSVGSEIDLTTGRQAARFCALNILGHLNAACGGTLDKVERCVKLGGFIASAPGFFEQPKVMDGASELIEQLFGATGKHTRFAVGVNALPLNATVEIDGIFALRV